jgi:AraC family transcriptional regulator
LSFKKIQPLMAFAAENADENISLAALSRKAGLSSYHVHREFTAVAGETPKQFTLRLRLGRAAGMLLATSESVVDVAFACGFQSHETFSRAFRKKFGITPSAYRVRGISGDARAHAAIVAKVAPCVGLFHVQEGGTNKVAYSITKKELSPQHALVMRRRVTRTEIAAALGEIFGQVFQYAQKNGIALAGRPFTRYTDMSMGSFAIEAGMAVAGPVNGQGDIVPATLPGGPAAFTVHMGPYDKLPEAFAAFEGWFASEGVKPGGAPWELYITDPAEHPDPKDWKTEIYWPLAI